MKEMLETFYRAKVAERAALEAVESYADLERNARAREGSRRNFHTAIDRANGTAIVAEIKRASPSAGVIVDDFDPARIARSYEAANADAISVVTERSGFGGRLEYLEQARSRTVRPILRKDFLRTRYDVVQSAAYGADAVLLIVAGLRDAQLVELIGESARFGLDALVEVHTAEELRRAEGAGARLLGINNRNLQTFECDLAVSERLLPLVPRGCTVLSESGVRSAADVARLAPLGARGFLVGEALLRCPDPKQAVLDFKLAAMMRSA